jgi:hypothetical protein
MITLLSLFAKYDSKYGALRLQRPSQPTAAPGDDPAVWGLIFRSASGSFAAPNPASSRPTISAAVSELSAYLDSDSLNQYDASFHVLNWWHDHKRSYPILSMLAKDIMTVPVSTISSESAFSLSGRLLDDRRRSLTPAHVERLSLIKD